MKKESIEKYEEIMRRDPGSQIFAALADAYRENGELEKAEKMARGGLSRHPGYVSGYVILGKILMAQSRTQDAEVSLQKAVTLGPENLLAHQLLGQLYLQSRRPKEALKSYKMALFLSPQNEAARNAVQRLESLSADEYDSDVFELQKPTRNQGQRMQSLPQSKERTLSLVDAYIVRNEIAKARTVLENTRDNLGEDPAWQERWELVAPDEPITGEKWSSPTPLSPDLSREQFIRQRKIRRLEAVLRSIVGRQISPS